MYIDPLLRVSNVFFHLCLFLGPRKSHELYFSTLHLQGEADVRGGAGEGRRVPAAGAGRLARQGCCSCRSCSTGQWRTGRVTHRSDQDSVFRSSQLKKMLRGILGRVQRRLALIHYQKRQSKVGKKQMQRKGIEPA